MPLAPWFYEQAFLILKKAGMKEKAVAVLQRFKRLDIGENPAKAKADLLARLEKEENSLKQ